MGSFSIALKTLRKQRGLSQAELAELLGMSKAAISMYETDRREPDFETMEKIADFFNVDMNYLYGQKAKDGEYYLDPEAAQIAQAIYEDRNLRILFDAARGSRAEDLQMTADMLKRFKESSNE